MMLQNFLIAKWVEFQTDEGTIFGSENESFDKGNLCFAVFLRRILNFFARLTFRKSRKQSK